jgi:DNA-binding NarL/FixJ family response regulator
MVFDFVSPRQSRSPAMADKQRPHAPPWNLDEQLTVRRMARQGKTTNDIATAFGIGPETVRKRCRRLGILLPHARSAH